MLALFLCYDAIEKNSTYALSSNIKLGVEPLHLCFCYVCDAKQCVKGKPVVSVTQSRINTVQHLINLVISVAFVCYKYCLTHSCTTFASQYYYLDSYCRHFDQTDCIKIIIMLMIMIKKRTALWLVTDLGTIITQKIEAMRKQSAPLQLYLCQNAVQKLVTDQIEPAVETE